MGRPYFVSSLNMRVRAAVHAGSTTSVISIGVSDGNIGADGLEFAPDRRAVCGGVCDTMKRENFSTNTKWEPIVGYSRAVKVGNLIFVTGTTATDESGAIVGFKDGDGVAYAQA